MPELDGLRGLAIIAVIWHNSVGAGQWEIRDMLARLINVLANVGWTGVQLFFVLSGFLITGILLDQKGSPHQFRNFFLRRILRIFPLYYTTLLLIFVVLPALGLAGVFGTEHETRQIWYWTFLANWSIPAIGGPPALSHFWSLAVEEQFYLLWPFVVIGLSRQGLAKVCLALIVSAIAIRALLIGYDLEFARWRAYEYTFVRWDALAIGALLAVVVRHQPWHRALSAWATPLLVASAVYIGVYIVIDHGYGAVDSGIAAFNQTIAAVLFAALLYRGIFPAAAGTSPWQMALRNAGLRNVGKYSYAIYVFHYPVLLLVIQYLEKHLPAVPAVPAEVLVVVRIVAVAVLSYALAWCSWRVLEQPFLRLKRLFGSPAAAPAT